MAYYRVEVSRAIVNTSSAGESMMGIVPMINGFANRRLTTWLHAHSVGTGTRTQNIRFGRPTL